MRAPAGAKSQCTIGAGGKPPMVAEKPLIRGRLGHIDEVPCEGDEIGFLAFLMASARASSVVLFWPWPLLAEGAACSLLMLSRRTRDSVITVWAPVIRFIISTVSGT